MDIVILGALPHDLMAKESLVHLEKQAPFLTSLLQTHKATTEWLDIEHLGCTPYEYYQLKQANYTAENNFYAKGLAALRCPNYFNIDPDQNIYLLSLCHVEIGLNHAIFYPQEELDISPEETYLFYQSAQTLIKHTPYQFVVLDEKWAVLDLGGEFNHQLVSPTLLATGNLNDWFHPETLPRTLRNFINELQMTWHDYPVNIARKTQGKKTINSAWIYGGAAKSTLTPYTSSSDTVVLDNLFWSHLHQDWGTWLSQLPLLDQQIKALHTPSTRYTLCGFDRLVSLDTPSKIKQLFSNKNQWKQWWSQSK